MPNPFVFNYLIKSDSYASKQKVCRTVLVLNLSKYIHSVKKNGFLLSIKKMVIVLYRYIFKSRDYFYCCDVKDFNNWKIKENDTLRNMSIIIIPSEKELKDKHLSVIFENEGNRDNIIAHIKRYFGKGFVLYLFSYNDEIIGYTWVVFGDSTDKYIPLGKNDVYLVSVFIFQKYRGKKYYKFAVYKMLQLLIKGGVLRVYYAVHEWNKSMIKATSITCFYCIGLVKKIRIFNTSVIKWYNTKRISK